MGIVFDPEMYRAAEKHFAHCPLPAYPDKWETWHTDACYENGYFSTIMWATNGPVIMVALHVIDPTGKSVVESMQFFEPGDYVASTETLDIKMGDNYYRGKFPKYELCVHDGNNGAELVYEPLIYPTISELPDGVGLGRLSAPYMPIFVGWFFMPWNKVTGKLIIEGKEIPVTGNGWADHQFGNVDFFKDACQYFYWGCFPLGEHTLTFFETQLTDKGGYRPLKWLWNWKGEKLYEYCRDCDYYIQASDIEEGGTVPRKLVIVFEHSRIRGIVTCNFKALIQKQPLDYGGRKVVLNRSAYDCHAKLEIDNEKINTKFTRIMEAAYGVEQIIEEVEEKIIEEVKTTRFSQDSTLGEVLRDPAAREVLERYVPGISTSSQAKLGYDMALKTIFSFPQAGVSKEKLAAIDEELRALG